MQGLILLAALLLLFVVLGLTIEKVTGPVRLLMATAIVIVTGLYLIF
ncbi:MAG: hypothetical protein ABR978_08980 [Dehalococcoidia bacterium]|jgi:hypothetical protein